VLRIAFANNKTVAEIELCLFQNVMVAASPAAIGQIAPNLFDAGLMLSNAREG
jgi:hypothetical protein